MSAAVKTLIQKPLALFVTTTCPFCMNARKLVSQHGIDAAVVELDKDKSGSEIRQLLTEMTKQRTVPYVFSKGEFLGGYSDLAEKVPKFWDALK